MASGDQLSPSTQPPAFPPPGADGESILRFEHVTVAFDDVVALNDVSFDVRRGQTLIILGSAASGKSVLLKAAAGLVQLASGNVFLFD